MLKDYKYRIYPDREQQVLINKSIGCCRYIYNWALARRKNVYETEKRTLSVTELSRELTYLKKEPEYEWLNEVSSEILQQAIRNMDSAYNHFFKHGYGFPKFKSKHYSGKSFKNINGTGIDFDKKRIKVLKIGKIKFALDRKFEGILKSIVISQTPTNKYYASVLVDDGKPLPEKAKIEENSTVGIDVGIKDFATLSSGTKISNPKYYENDEKRIKVLHRRVSRKQKGSNRRMMAVFMLAKRYEKIANKRKDFLHKAVKMIVSENQTVVIEDLNVEGMLQNHNLAKSIQSVSWSEFFRILNYKCEWHGKNLIRIGRFEPSSKLCTCGFKHDGLKLSDRQWQCPACGTVHDRDILAANNIKRFGLQKLNLKTPAIGGKGDVEFPALVGAKKRQNMNLRIVA
ncbi:MAG: transposase [Tannerella sp.]|jgi:putative transposase|nr:transposase [Tannerella sp.]